MGGDRAAGRRRSLIAGANAWFRACQTPELKAHAVLDDPWARRLADRDLRFLLVWLISKMLPSVGDMLAALINAHCIRHRTIDDLILTATRADGFTQVVLIGAGYDMRASRFARDLVDVHWIELDDPRTQRRKWDRLRSLPGVRPVALASGDFESEGLSALLARAGFDANQPTCFVLEGVIHYLSSASFARLLDVMAGVPAPVRVLMSFIEPSMRASAPTALTSLFRLVREIPRSFMSSAEIEATLRARGFRSFATWTLPEQLARLSSWRPSPGSPLPARWWQTVACAGRPVEKPAHG